MNLFYVIDARRDTGHAGRYPRPIARMVARVLRRFSDGWWGIAPRIEGY